MKFPPAVTAEEQLSASSFDVLMRRLLHTCREETHSANQWAAKRALKGPLPLPGPVQSSNVLLIHWECLMMTQINRHTYPGGSSGAFSYPAGFSHTNLKIQWAVFRAISYSCQFKRIKDDTRSFLHWNLKPNFFQHKSQIYFIIQTRRPPS